ncbi:MAG TPA: AtpZ/AtpI family protein [Armatimonadota bacterium]|jgi:ATP synthase protein I|nr:AtpZ/AtpI family protein [Armatimonadota bacterium]HOM83433.1 AtpZ/AtpI family protein [Armatimonadota bacterium]HPO74140.1 AtpZ/AtpI family protein [Armatimonadota bacterium]
MRPNRLGDSERKWIRNMALAGQVGIFLAAAIFIGWALGQWLDRKLGTDPWLTALFTLLGAAAGFLELFRVAAQISGDE